RTAAVTLSVCCLLTSCSRGDHAGGAVQRVAILPFENLTESTELDWISRAAAAVLAYDLTGPRNIYPIRVESIRDARLNRAVKTVEGYFAREHGALSFHATVGNQTIVVSGDDVAGDINRLAKQLSADARTLAGCDAAAL